MHISPWHKGRQVSDEGITNAGVTVSTAAAAATGSLVFDASAHSLGVTAAPPLVSGSNIIITTTPTTTSSSPLSSATSSPSDTAAAASSGSSKSDVPIGTVIGACVGAFIGVVVLLILFYAWFKRSTDKLSAAARRNAQNKAEQQRQRPRQFQPLADPLEKPSAAAAAGPTSPKDSDTVANFSMFKKSSPSVRSGYTAKTDELLNTYDLPPLQFTKYHPSLAQELALSAPEKPFAAAATTERQNSGVSWDGETLGDDSFLSLRSVRVDSGTMSPTMVMAKMTPPATASALHRWESAEVLQVEEVPKNPFADMVEQQEERDQRARSTNPFFNAQEAQRSARARSRSNSRTSRAQSLVRSDSRATITPAHPHPHAAQERRQSASANPFLDIHEAVPVSAVEALSPGFLGQNKPSVPSGASASAFGSERAMESLIAALNLSKEEVEARLRVSVQGSTYSAYSETDESDMATVREFPLPPGARS